MERRLETLFKIHPSEQRVAALVFGYGILLFSAGVLASTASLGLFFETFDATTLPYSYLLLVVIGPLVTFVTLRLNHRFTLSDALLTIHSLLLLSLIALPLVLKFSETPVIRFLLPVYVEVNVILTYTSFWNLVGRIYTLRQGKRLFPVLISSEHVGAIGTGFLATFFIARFGTIDLFWPGALFMVGAIALLLVINRVNEEKMGGNVSDAGESSRTRQFGTLVKEPYVRLMFAVVTLYTLGAFMVRYLAFAEAEIRFTTSGEMATYVAVFMGLYGAFGLIVQWLVAGRFLDRFGVLVAFLSLPAGMFILVAFFALIGSFNGAVIALFWLSSGANMYYYTLDALYAAGKNVMLQPLPAHLRTQVQTTTTGVAYPLATGLSGLLLLLLLDVLGFDSVRLSYAILVVLASWLAVGVWLNRAYVNRLRQALQAGRFGKTSLFRSADHSTISVLVESLNSSHIATVLFALDMLAEIAPVKLQGHLTFLLSYPDDRVKLAALGHIKRLALTGAANEVRALLLENTSPELRAAALRTWYAIDPGPASEGLVEFSFDLQAPVRQAALAILFQHQDPALRERALETLNDLLSSPVPAERILAAGVIGETGAAEDTDPFLLTLLADKDPVVQCAALATAARSAPPSAWSFIIPFLANTNTRSLAANALVPAGDALLPMLQEVCLKHEQNPQLLTGIAFVCGRIASQAAIGILETLLNNTDATVRRQAMVELSRRGYQAPSLQRTNIRERLRLQVVSLAEIVASQVDIQSSGDGSAGKPTRLVADALEQRRQEESDNILLLLSFLFESQTMLSIREAMQHGRSDEDKQAYAIETLDILLDHTDKRLLFPFLQQLDSEQRLKKIPKQLSPILLGREQRLYRLLAVDSQENDRWTRICAIHALGPLGGDGAARAIVDTALTFRDDPVLLETALNSLEQLGVSLEEIAAANPGLEQAVEQWRSRDPEAMSLLQKAESIKQVSIFAALPGRALETLAGSMKCFAVRMGEKIIQKGELGDKLYFILDGQLRVHENGRTFETLGSGAVVGEMALLDAQPRSASVTALTDCRLLELDQEPFSELLATDPQVARELLVLLSRRLRDRLTDVVSKSMERTVQPVFDVARGQKGIGMGAAVAGVSAHLDRLLALKGTDLFGNLDSDLLEQVAVLLEEVNLSGGETLFRAGDPGHSLYIVVIGQVWVHIGERTLEYLGEGKVIGEMSLLDSEPRSATVTAVVPTQLLRLNQGPFFQLLELQPALARAMIRMISRRLRARMQELGL